MAEVDQGALTLGPRMYIFHDKPWNWNEPQQTPRKFVDQYLGWKTTRKTSIDTEQSGL
jgi:hypothetical protein